MQVSPASALTNSLISTESTVYPSSLTSAMLLGNASFIQRIVPILRTLAPKGSSWGTSILLKPSKALAVFLNDENSHYYDVKRLKIQNGKDSLMSAIYLIEQSIK